MNGWPDYQRKVRLLWEGTRKRARKRLGPTLVRSLTGTAWDITQEIDHEMLRSASGARYLLDFLQERLGRTSVPDAGIRLEELLIKMRRNLGEGMASWANRVRESYRKLQRALQRVRTSQQATLKKGLLSLKDKETTTTGHTHTH
jgi:hypothetical protein